MPNKEPTQSYPVWVGGLEESVTESTLRSQFEKFGPVRSVVIIKDPETRKSKQFGYINYHNDEVAEVAALEMNGSMIQGKKIKTKGPKQLHLSTSTAVNSTDKKDIKSLTDCYHFMEKGECKMRANQNCQFRHSEKARSSQLVCEKWFDKSCAKKKCPKQHPGQTPEKVQTAKDVSLDRCNSHNAFKCYGQCGQDECNTHFQTEQDLVDHVLKGKDLFSPCVVCNAVFFNKEEKDNHIHTKDPQSTKSGLPANPPTGNHNNSEPIGVFWDIENCRVPRGRSAIAVVNKIRKKFYPGRREVEFMCVCDTKKEKKEILEELNKAQINIVHINATSKNAADDKLKQALRRFAQAHMPPATIVVVSGDINFASELSDLRHRHNLRVILVHNKQASDALLNCAHECECFDEFTTGLPLCTVSTQVDASTEILLTNLPSGSKHSMHKIKGRLNALVSNTGGKVISISPFDDDSKDNVAVIRFPDISSAQRGVQRLNKETVFGSEIRTNYYNIKKKGNDLVNKGHEKQNLTSNLKKSSSVNRKLNNFNPEKPPSIKQASTNVLSNGILCSKPYSSSLDEQNMVSTGTKDHNDTACQLDYRKLASSLIQNTIQNSQSGIDLLITNLDQTAPMKDLKKQLTLLVREHCKVNSVIITSHGKENSLHAFVKIPKLQDAQFCISKLNNQMLFNKRIRVCFVSAKDNTLLKMKSEVTAVLLSSCNGWLPMKDFLTSFKDRYQHAFHVLNFDQVRDVIYVDGAPSRQFVCLLHFPVGLIKLGNGCQVVTEIIRVLKSHNRRVPLASILGLYWSYLKKPVPVTTDGEFLFKLLLSNQQICLLGNTPPQQAIFYKKERPEKGKKASVEEICSDFVQLLQVSPGFSVPFAKLVPLYHQFFGRQCCITDYGFKDLSELLKAFTDVIQISQTSNGKTVTFTSKFRQQLLEKNLSKLLQDREKQKLPVSSLMTSYYRFFGHKMYFRNFGFSSLATLIMSLNKQKFKISGCGDGKVLILCHENPKNQQTSLQVFAEEVVSLVREQPDQRLGLHHLSSEYYKLYGKQLKLCELGFSKLNDLITAISDYIEISGSKDQRILHLSKENPNFESAWRDIENVLSYSTDEAILVLLLPNFYKEKLHRPFPLDAVKMDQFFKKLSKNILSVGKGSHQIIFYHNPDAYPSKLLIQKLLQLLYSSPQFKNTPQWLSDSLYAFHKIHVNPSRILKEAVNDDNFQVGKGSLIQLSQQTARKIFHYEMVQILNELPDKQALLSQVVMLYSKRFSKSIRLADYGVPKLQALFEKSTPRLFEITNENSQPMISLGPLGELYPECQSVLEENDGSLLLCNFAPEYQRKFSKRLKATEYGFQKIGDLVECLSGVVIVYGEKNMKVVVLKERLLNPKNEIVAEDYVEKTDESEADVIIESEEFEEDMAVPDVSPNVFVTSEDLLQFSENEKQTNPANIMEWWMEPIPELPTPALQPELHPQSTVSCDLISFSDFGENEELRNGGLDQFTLATSSNKPLSFGSRVKPSDDASADFVDRMFCDDLPSNIPSTNEPDLMRLLVGRCSPVPGFSLTTAPCFPENESGTTDSTVSGMSESYSCYSVLENLGREQQTPSYGASLNAIFSNQLQFGTRNKVVRPKIAANFNKNY